MTLATACGPVVDDGGPQQVSIMAVAATETAPEIREPASETWATFVSASVAAPAAIVVGYNDLTNVVGIARSTGGPFTQCIAQNCGPGGGPIPPARGQATQVLDNVTVGLYAGDPAIAGMVAPAGTAGNGVVVATNVAISAGGHGARDMLLAITSFDGGQTFVRSDQVTAGRPHATVQAACRTNRPSRSTRVGRAPRFGSVGGRSRETGKRSSASAGSR